MMSFQSKIYRITVVDCILIPFFINLECVQSYGENCRNPCSPHCYNQTCEKFKGQCLFGCNDGFYGEKCERGNVYTFIRCIDYDTVTLAFLNSD